MPTPDGCGPEKVGARSGGLQILLGTQPPGVGSGGGRNSPRLFGLVWLEAGGSQRLPFGSKGIRGGRVGPALYQFRQPAIHPSAEAAKRSGFDLHQRLPTVRPAAGDTVPRIATHRIIRPGVTGSRPAGSRRCRRAGRSFRPQACLCEVYTLDTPPWFRFMAANFANSGRIRKTGCQGPLFRAAA